LGHDGVGYDDRTRRGPAEAAREARIGVAVSRKRVLVTGGAGFIGSNIVDALLADGAYAVRVLDSFATGRRGNLAHCLGDIELVEGDIRDVETVEEAVDGVQLILHQAALPSVTRSVKAPVTTNAVNVEGTLKLLCAARRAGVERLVLASSSSVYGDGRELPKSERMPLRPMSPYAVTKSAAEDFCRVFSEIYGLETVALRYFNVFGPRQDPTSQYSGVIAKFASCALRGEPYSVCGDGTQSRDFSYIDNIVHANLLALRAPHVTGEAINVACGDRIQLLDMIAILNDLVGRDIPIRHGASRPGEIEHSQASIEKAAAILGYAPVVEFREGLSRTLAWFQSHPAERVD
jgi:UDP-glucose 4-epimerase